MYPQFRDVSLNGLELMRKRLARYRNGVWLLAAFWAVSAWAADVKSSLVSEIVSFALYLGFLVGGFYLTWQLRALDEQIAWVRDQANMRPADRSNTAAWIGFAGAVLTGLVTIIVAKID